MGMRVDNVIGSMPKSFFDMTNRPNTMQPVQQQPTMPVQAQNGIGSQVSAAAQSGTTGQDLQALVQSLLADRQNNAMQQPMSQPLSPQVMPQATQMQGIPQTLPMQAQQRMPQFGQPTSLPYFGMSPFGFQQNPYQGMPFQGGFSGAQGLFSSMSPYLAYFNNRFF